jgi:PhoPQ-activated pathogenicity-related protein
LHTKTLFNLATLLLATILIAPVACSQDKPVAQGLATTTAVDDSYRFESVGEFQVGACKAYSYKMTSQTWQGTPWTHWLSILVPPQVDHTDAAVLFITGGSTSSSQPQADSTEAQLFGVIATMAKVPVAILQQVPNQPLQGGLQEDDLIAFTFDKYLNNQGDDWPLLLPMVESARRAMDTVSTIMAEKAGTAIKRFVISGASKRGWTTWLTAAADKRVIAIAPMVIDMLNMQPQMEQQIKSYGKFSGQIDPYSKLKIQARLTTARGKQLASIVDPYAYRHSLTLPKLIVLGTNDPYWTVDAASLYYPGLTGTKHLYYLANAGHGLGASIAPTVATFFKKSIDGETFEMIKWQHGSDGLFHVKWKGEHGQARLWTATSETRDFRQSKWTSQDLIGENSIGVNLPEPRSGWVAFYVQVELPGLLALKYSICTEIQVLPKTFPFTYPAETPK